MSIRKHIPNTITCLSLLSGCVASVMALHGNLLSALIWIIIAAVFDLAKFNIDERQTTSFIGLSVPAHALFWASVGYSVLPVIHANEGLFVLVTVILAFITSLLLVSEIPMFSLKVKSLAWKGNELRYILIACAIIFVALWGFLGISGTILLYIVLSIFNKKG